MLRDAPARGGEVAGGGGEEVVVRVAGEAAVAGVGLHGREDRGEFLVGGHVVLLSKWAKRPRQIFGTSAFTVIGSCVVG